jgi:hypothetical protein
MCHGAVHSHVTACRAAAGSNLEALLKLSSAHLYGEAGVSQAVMAVQSRATVENNPVLSAKYVVAAENLLGAKSPFCWTLLRPPWPALDCYKAKVFQAVTAAVLEMTVRKL